MERIVFSKRENTLAKDSILCYNKINDSEDRREVSDLIVNTK